MATVGLRASCILQVSVDLRGLRQVLSGQGGSEGSVFVGLTAQGGARVSGHKRERGPVCRRANVRFEEGELVQGREEGLTPVRDQQCGPGLRGGGGRGQDGARGPGPTLFKFGPRHPRGEGLGVGYRSSREGLVGWWCPSREEGLVGLSPSREEGLGVG